MSTSQVVVLVEDALKSMGDHELAEIVRRLDDAALAEAARESEGLFAAVLALVGEHLAAGPASRPPPSMSSARPTEAASTKPDDAAGEGTPFRRGSLNERVWLALQRMALGSDNGVSKAELREELGLTNNQAQGALAAIRDRNLAECHGRGLASRWVLCPD